MKRRLLQVAALAAVAHARLLLPATPPAGTNTFMSYNFEDLNSTSLPALAREAAASPLAGALFENFVVDGGWSISMINGTAMQNLDGYGRPVPAPERFPGDSMLQIATYASTLGLRFGLWAIRGVHVDAVARKLPIKGMEQYTLDQIVDSQPAGGGKNGSCLWASQWLGVNTSHPAAQAYYDSVVEQLVENLGARLIKGDCFFCRPCYSDEMLAFTAAVRARPEPVMLYYSPGGGALVSDGEWAASNAVASFYRTITDFDSGDWYDWGGLQQAFFIAGNFSNAGLTGGSNRTIADLDMLPMDGNWWGDNSPTEKLDRGQTICSLWMMGRYPLFYAGALPIDQRTLSYLTNPLALALNRRADVPGVPTRVSYRGNCTCTGEPGSCTIPHGPGDHPAQPCVAAWVAAVPATEAPAWTALMLSDIGEDSASTSTSFADLGLPADPAARYSVIDIWTGESVPPGSFSGADSIDLSLRPHASALLRIASL